MNIDFISKRATFFTVSLVAVIVCLGFVFTQGLNLSIEFKSGSVMRLTFVEKVSTSDVKKVLALDKFGEFFKKVEVQQISSDNIIANSGSEFFVTSDFIAKTENAQNIEDKLVEELGKSFPSVRVSEFVNVGASIGDDLKESAIYSIIFSILVIVMYISFRFEFKFSIVAIIALIHDVTIVLGLFALFHKEFSASTIAALLTIIGYSLNDTIVVLDRVRENMKLLRKEKFDFIVNKSINQSLSRTINTSVTTLTPIAILFIFGGTGVHEFSFAMFIGVLVGTYSSIFVASPLLVTLLSSSSNPEEAQKVAA
ncbi:MAG: protein translocase subunit SecF [Candidatus Cloacimonadota bacterium]|nr:MAG: protein translocase subunit SecF [Candidatus Cloacimonadota bacterium]